MRLPILLLAPLALTVACTPTAKNPLQLVVGPDGGSLHTDALQLDVPAGAVDSSVTITAYPMTRTIDGVTTASQTWVFGPEGQTFAKPISVGLAFSGNVGNATVWWTKQGDVNTFSNLVTTAQGSWATADVTHFSEGTVGDGDTCSGGDDTGEADTGEKADTGEEADTREGGDSGDAGEHEGEDSGDADTGEHDGQDSGDADTGEHDGQDSGDADTGEHEGDHDGDRGGDGDHADGDGPDDGGHGACEHDEHRGGGDGDGGEGDGDGDGPGDSDTGE